MIPKVIKTEKDYDRALERINDLMDADPGTSEEDELEKLVALVELYEKEKHPIGLPDPVKAPRSRRRRLG
jgi:HTH-type transcriptional regulator/antitoxin HigA